MMKTEDTAKAFSARTASQLPIRGKKCHLKLVLEVAGEGVFLQAGLIILLVFSLPSSFPKSPQPFLPSSDKEGDEHRTECCSPLCHCKCAPHMMWDGGIFGTWPLCI